MNFDTSMIVGVIGAGAMGSGIAQVAATAGHTVIIFDTNVDALGRSKAALASTLDKLVAKGKLADASIITSKITYTSTLADFAPTGLVIEAIVENLAIKKSVFADLEAIVSEDCILASNTSSLSITSIAAACKLAHRVIGIHFFNPAPLMALVEIIPAIQTDEHITIGIKQLIADWKKQPVLAKDTPGFIVNRVARPFYGEAIKIMEEGIADMATIDWALTTIGGFKMGPFTLMDYIGHDVNYVVTETVYQSFFYDSRYKPSFAQKRLLEANWLGRKTGRGFYNYAEGAVQPVATESLELGQQIVERVVLMLINEAVDALYLNVASKEDIDLAMTKGVNYPKGLLAWAEEMGVATVLEKLDGLYHNYHDERYRASVLLRKMLASNQTKF